MPANIKKGDTVIVLSGRDKGKKEKVLNVWPKEDRVLVEKVNIAKKHLRATQKFQGGIVDRALALPLGKVMLVCPHCHQPARVKSTLLADGERARACGRCQEVIS